MLSLFPYSQGTFMDHTKVHDPTLPTNIVKKTIYIPNNHPTTVVPKVYQTTILSRPVSGTSTNQLRSITSRHRFKRKRISLFFE